MIKQRILGMALSLALLATLGLSLTASADTPPATDEITVSAQVVDTLTLSLNIHAIDFGQNLDFLGNGAGLGITTCTNPAETGIQGARYVSPNVVATVQSNMPYDIGRGVLGDLSSLQALHDRGWVGSGAFTGCGTSATSIGFILDNLPGTAFLDQNAAPTAGQSYTEFYMLDVLVDSPADIYSTTITYAVAQHV